MYQPGSRATHPISILKTYWLHFSLWVLLKVASWVWEGKGNRETAPRMTQSYDGSLRVAPPAIAQSRL